MRCKHRDKNFRPWIRGIRCRKEFDHNGFHAGWFAGSIKRWTS